MTAPRIPSVLLLVVSVRRFLPTIFTGYQGWIHAVAGQAERAKALLESWSLPWQPDDLHDRARIHAVLGDHDAALRYLERAGKEGLRRSAKLPPDPELSALVSDPRYGAAWERILFE